MTTQNSVSFSYQSKQVSRCFINFPHELDELENELEPAFFLKLVTCQRITSKNN